MHELALVRSIFSTLEETLEVEEMKKVTRVDLKIGKLANVEPILLQNAFKAFQESHLEYKQVQLETMMVDIVVHCHSCEEDSKVEQYKFMCKKCGTPTTHIISGEELLIHQIHFDPVHS